MAKGLGGLIVALSGKSKESKAEEGEMSGKEAVADEVLSAIASKDAKALSTALADFVSLCGEYSSSDEE